MKHEILNELTALETHYPRVVRSPDEQERWYGDYLEDLKDFEIEAVRYACAEWRKTAARKFPNTGELRLLAARHRASLADTADRLEIWRPLSDAEYEALSLRDKIRHQMILASEADGKAGPMWGLSGPKAIEDMPPEWHEWKRRAAGHRQEANRLRAIIEEREARGDHAG